MKKSLAVLLFGVCLACVLAAGIPAYGAEGYVPDTVAQVEDPGLRSALQSYAPNYDSLSKADQIALYNHVYGLDSGATFFGLEPETAEIEPDALPAIAYDHPVYPDLDAGWQPGFYFGDGGRRWDTRWDNRRDNRPGERFSSLWDRNDHRGGFGERHDFAGRGGRGRR